MESTCDVTQARALTVLFVTTFAFAACFAAWMMFGVTGIPIRKELGLNATEFGVLTATPVLWVRCSGYHSASGPTVTAAAWL